MPESGRFRGERDQLELFRALPGDFAPRDAQDLMAYPFFSLSKSPRVTPIDYRMGDVAIRVEATAEHGMATIWDADVLIWAASQLVEARDNRLRTSRLMAATPHEILTFIGRGTSVRDYQRLKSALDRLQSTTVATTLRQPAEQRMHRFSWVNEWKERADAHGRPLGIELIIPDWLYAAVLNDALVLTIDPAYFRMTGGLERWLYRIVRKHAGRQPGGWCFEISHLHLKSGSLSPLKRFVALPGQSVCRSELLISVDGIEMGAALEHDRHGRTLPAWQGCRVIARGEVFLMNWDEPQSLDSRYFGPIPLSAIVGRAEPVWTFEEE